MKELKEIEEQEMLSEEKYSQAYRKQKAQVNYLNLMMINFKII